MVIFTLDTTTVVPRLTRPCLVRYCKLLLGWIDTRRLVLDQWPFNDSILTYFCFCFSSRRPVAHSAFSNSAFINFHSSFSLLASINRQPIYKVWNTLSWVRRRVRYYCTRYYPYRRYEYEWDLNRPDSHHMRLMLFCCLPCLASPCFALPCLQLPAAGVQNWTLLVQQVPATRCTSPASVCVLLDHGFTASLDSYAGWHSCRVQSVFFQ